MIYHKGYQRPFRDQLLAVTLGNTLNPDELQNAWKCLGLGYLGMNEPMWQNSAAIVLQMECRTFTSLSQKL